MDYEKSFENECRKLAKIQIKYIQDQVFSDQEITDEKFTEFETEQQKLIDEYNKYVESNQGLTNGQKEIIKIKFPNLLYAYLLIEKASIEIKMSFLENYENRRIEYDNRINKMRTIKFEKFKQTIIDKDIKIIYTIYNPRTKSGVYFHDESKAFEVLENINRYKKITTLDVIHLENSNVIENWDGSCELQEYLDKIKN